MIKAELIDYMGSDLTVVNAARVSFAKESNWNEEGELNVRDRRLISYLGAHNHISPFGHNFATFWCSAPIFVCRQLVKHKFLRWNEVSRRYVNDDPEFYHPPKLRSKSDDKKQAQDQIWTIPATTCTTSSRSSRSKVLNNTSIYSIVCLLYTSPSPRDS